MAFASDINHEKWKYDVNQLLTASENTVKPDVVVEFASWLKIRAIYGPKKQERKS